LANRWIVKERAGDSWHEHKTGGPQSWPDHKTGRPQDWQTTKGDGPPYAPL